MPPSLRKALRLSRHTPREEMVREAVVMAMDGVETGRETVEAMVVAATAVEGATAEVVG